MVARGKIGDGAVPLRGSVLDRLMYSPASPGAASSARPAARLESVGVREVFESVTRDLEWLLNTKRWFAEGRTEELPHVSRSILAFGLPDLSTYSWRNQRDARTIARLLEETICTFEPRLRPNSVKVVPFESSDPEEFRLRFRVDAVLHVEPIRAPVSFDTDVEFDSSCVTVRGAS